VLLPYESREQVTSGVLVEALAAGKPVIATAFPHAVELAASGAVAVVPHEQPAAMARALAAVLSQPAEAHRMAAAAARVARGHDWPAVGERYRSVIATACHERRAVGSVA
jgi:glycosyltransferase involved in cell wall biosynthesis